jgi:hypothetical protein
MFNSCGAALFDVGVDFTEHSKNSAGDHISHYEGSDFNSL